MGTIVFPILQMRKLTCRESGLLLISTHIDLLLVKCTERNLFFKLVNACYVSLEKTEQYLGYIHIRKYKLE